MRFAHISDLHIGKRVNEISMIKDQRYILDEIIRIIKENHVDAVLIAGDLYDKSMPSAEAVSVCDDFLTKLATTGKHIFVISGNHDCEERVAFAGRIMEHMNIHIAPVFDGHVSKYSLENVDVYLLPFIKPIGIKQYYENQEINNHNDAVKAALSEIVTDKNKCNILVAHQFVTGALRSESEETCVGGLDNVDADTFKDFDYVALGHIHRGQHVQRDTVRYCGSPLKYSFSEVSHKKSVTLVDVKDKEISISEIPLIPLHDMRDIRGTFEEVTSKEFYKEMDTMDYVRIILTDEEDVPDAVSRLRSIYPNIMRLEYDNKRTRAYSSPILNYEVTTKTGYELFTELYESQNNAPMSAEQSEYVKTLLEEIFDETY
ncbi:MAG: exonuclease SbcCD subunit D [Lachnospira sp.]|nr:exonuclease SbcCD subunit D [Lachnospira sp.]